MTVRQRRLVKDDSGCNSLVEEEMCVQHRQTCACNTNKIAQGVDVGRDKYMSAKG